MSVGAAPPVGSTNRPPSVAVDTPQGVQLGDVRISYVLEDAEAEACSLVLDFSRDGGLSYRPATLRDAATGLASAPGGISHVVTWDSLVDGVGLEDVLIRLTPHDGNSLGAATSTGPVQVRNPVSKIAEVTSPRFPPGLPASWQHVRLGYASPGVLVESGNAWMPWGATVLEQGATQGAARVLSLQLLARDAAGVETVIVENDFRVQREVAWGVYSVWPTWFGSQTYTTGWLSHPAGPSGADFAFGTSGVRPLASPDEAHHWWLTRWPRPRVPSTLEGSTTELGVRMTVELRGGVLVSVGLDRYETDSVVGTSVGDRQWEELHSGWFRSSDGTPQSITLNYWVPVQFQ